MKRDLGFDAAKGFAIYSVVVLHIINFLGWRNDNILHYIVSYYMPIFFFISGYFGYKKDLDACLVIKK